MTGCTSPEFPWAEAVCLSRVSGPRTPFRCQARSRKNGVFTSRMNNCLSLSPPSPMLIDPANAKKRWTGLEQSEPLSSTSLGGVR